MALEKSKIDELRKKVAKLPEETKAINEIGTTSPKTNIPVMIDILKEIDKNLSEQNHLSEEKTHTTRNFLDFAIKKLTESDEKQNATLFALPKILMSLKPEIILSDLQELVTAGHKVHVTSSTDGLWQELALWLEGTYKHTYDKTKKGPDGKVLKNKDGTIGPIDIEDSIFTTIMQQKLCKFTVANFYHLAAEAIRERRQIYQQEQTNAVNTDEEENLIKFRR